MPSPLVGLANAGGGGGLGLLNWLGLGNMGGMSGGLLDPRQMMLMQLSQGLFGFGAGLANAPRGQGIGQGLLGMQQGMQQGRETALQEMLYGRQAKQWEREETKYQREQESETAKQKAIDDYIAQADPAERLYLKQLDAMGMLDEYIQQGMKPEEEPQNAFSAAYADWKRQHPGEAGPPLDWINQYRQADRPQTNISTTVKNYGDIPPGYRLVETPEGMTMEAVPGSPPAQAAATEKAAQKRSTDIVTGKIDEALKIIDEARLPATGIPGTLTAGIPTSPANRLAATIDTIKANVGFDRLQQMRKSSPTGGALGQVTEMELQRLEATIANLAISQGEEQLKQNLEQVRNVYLDIVHGPGNRPGKETDNAAIDAILAKDPATWTPAETKAIEDYLKQ